MEKLSYLDLELNTKNKIIIIQEGFKHSCYFNKTYKHELHSEHKQLNGITDLLINLGSTLESKNISNNTINITKEMLENIIQNQQYNKNQLTFMLDKLQKIEQNKTQYLVTNENKKLEEISNQIKELEKNLAIITPVIKETKRIVAG